MAWGVLAVMSYVAIRCLLAARRATSVVRDRLLTCGIGTLALLPAGINPSLGILPPLTAIGLVFLASAAPHRAVWLNRFLLGIGLVMVLGTAIMASSGYILSLGSGPSMWPTTSRHLSLAIMKSQTDGFKRGDTISFGVPGSEASDDPESGWPVGRYHKRIIGLPGDHVLLDDYTIHLNGQTVADCHPEKALEVLDTYNQTTWLCRGELDGKAYTLVWGTHDIWMNGRQEWALKEGEALVLGDNLPESADSRYRGAIPLRWVVGRFTSSW